MSQTITLGKSRKDGQWQIIVTPEKPFGEHLEAYRKIANKAPVNAEFSEVIIGKIQHSSPHLRLVTAEESANKTKSEIARQESVKAIVASADNRQAEMDAKIEADRRKTHAEIIEEKNAMIDKIR